jgi:hypothetical protein
MDFREREMGFREADRRYAELKGQLDAGTISTEEFDAQRRRLMVQDDEGRWWAKSRKSGEWNYRDGDTWVRGTPPGYQEEVVPEPTTDSSPARTPSPPHLRGVENEKDERQRGLPWVPVATGLVGLVALVGVGLISWMLAPYLWSDEDDVVPAAATVALPDVVGMSQDEAEENLRDAGFEAEAETQESSEEDKGVVMEQSPSAGAEAEENSTVAITVGEGRPAASGYVLVENDSGNLSMQVPSEWSEHSTGEDGTLEGADVDAGEGVGPAITASTDIETFESTGEVPGAYILASRSLAREYDEDQLATSGFNDRPNCEVVAREDFDRSPYSGRLVSWNCSTNGSTSYSLAAAPEGRECVVMLQITAYSEADRESAKHILDTFEVDCGRIV